MQRGAHLAAPISTLYPSSRWLLIPLSPKHTFLTEKKIIIIVIIFSPAKHLVFDFEGISSTFINQMLLQNTTKQPKGHC